MKKGLILAALLSVAALASCGNPQEPSSQPSEEQSSQVEQSSEEQSSEEESSEEQGGTEVAELPAPWADGENEYKANKCSVTLVPAEGSTQKAVKDYFTVPGIRFYDLRDVQEGYGVGHVERFESISYFKVICGSGEAGNTTLFKSVDGQFVANYTTSEQLLNAMFPKDATLFLMCQSGGRVVNFIKLLKQYGYDMNKVYNVGGWNSVDAVAEENYGGYGVSVGIGGTTTYNFSDLTPVAPAAQNARRANDLPAPWADGENEYKANKSSVTLVPAEGSTQKAVKDYYNVPGIRFYDLRDIQEGYGVGHVAGFESISYFKVICGSGEAGNTTLFKSVDGQFVANYTTSEQLLNAMFPKDATLFLMCQSGGRVVNFIKLLKQYGYDMNKVYNVGGWNSVDAVAEENYGGYGVSVGIGGTTTYNFSDLTPVTPAA